MKKTVYWVFYPALIVELSAIVIANQIDLAKWRHTLTAGIEYNPLAKKVSLLVNLVAVTSTWTKRGLATKSTKKDFSKE